MNLPNRSEQAEDIFLAELQKESNTAQCVEAIQQAIQEKRPQLAGKIFALIQEPIEMDEDLKKAQRALAFFLIHQKDEQWLEFQEHWDSYYKSNQVRRIRARHKPTLDFGTRSWKRRR